MQGSKIRLHNVVLVTALIPIMRSGSLS